MSTRDPVDIDYDNYEAYKRRIEIDERYDETAADDARISQFARSQNLGILGALFPAFEPLPEAAPLHEQIAALERSLAAYAVEQNA